MKLLIGLGNPGEKYKNTRHNIGREIVACLAVEFNFPGLAFKKSLAARISSKNLYNEKNIIACPETFMNLSGQAAAKLKKFYKIQTEDIWIIYDDLSLPLGSLRVRLAGSSGGHNGVQSVIDYLKTDQVAKFRIGIKPNRTIKINTADFVLKKFARAEQSIIKKTIAKCLKAIDYALQFGLEKTMSKYNT